MSVLPISAETSKRFVFHLCPFLLIDKPRDRRLDDFAARDPALLGDAPDCGQPTRIEPS
jgi:hypothetical protein